MGKTFTTFLFRLLGHMPLPVLHTLGFMIGTMIYFLPIRIRYYVSANLQICFPNQHCVARQLLLWRALREMAKGWLEAPVFWVRSQKSLLKLVKNKEAIEPVVKAVQAKEGALVIGTHLGAYYLKNALLAHYIPMTTYLYKPQKGIIGKVMHGLRNQFGGNLVSANKEGVLALLRHLKAGGAVGMIADHNVLDNGAVFVPFFGLDVPTMTLPARLAQKTQAPAYMATMERLSWARGYRLHVWPFPAEFYTADLTQAATIMNQQIEKVINTFPTQHEWAYRRFWDRPTGQSPVYKTQRY
jgi:KDO2-lipid IV(A) lauroyltransferase